MQRKQNKSTAKSQPQASLFKCSCGKQYQSKPAVYTHIKNKHNNDRSFKIIDANNGQISNSRTFKLQNIQVDHQESGLMILADLAFSKIYSLLKRNGLDLKHYIQSQDYLSDSEEDVSSIKDNVQMYFSSNELSSQYELLMQSQILSSATYRKFELSICKELSKFFISSFAWKIEVQIMLNLMKSKGFAKLDQYENTLLSQKERNIGEITEEYCQKWIALKA